MLKRIFVLFLFAQVSFCQDNQKEFEIKETNNKELINHFSVGFKLVTDFRKREDFRNQINNNNEIISLIKEAYYSQSSDGLLLNMDYFINKSSFGIELGTSFRGKTIEMMGIRYGLILFDKINLNFSYGYKLAHERDYVIFTNKVNSEESHYQKKESNYLGITFSLHNKAFNPQIGFNFNPTKYKFMYGINNQSIRSPEVKFNGISFTAGLKYKLYPSKKRAIKKLTQAKTALDLELITQQEYDKIYVKYAHFAKDKP